MDRDPTHTLTQFVTKQIVYSVGFQRRNLHHCPPHLKERAYKQIVLPSIEYCSTIWDPYQQTSIHKLEMIQHRAARFVLNRQTMEEELWRPRWR